MKPWLYLCILFCSLAPRFATPAPLLAAPAQQADVMIQIRNEVEQTLCDIYVAGVTAIDWGKDWLGDDTIALGETYSFSLAPGDYDIQITDCAGNLVLVKWSVTLDSNQMLPVTQVDIRSVACDVYNQQGLDASNYGQHQEASTAFESALACFVEVGDRTGEGVTLNNIGEIYHAQGRYGEALDSYQQALAIQREIDERDGEGVTLSNIGGLYYAQGRYGEALERYEQALAIAQELGDIAGKGTTLTNIGVVYRDQGRYDEALDNYQQALAIQREIGDRYGEGQTLNNIGAVYEAQDRYGEALFSYQQALAIRQAVGDRIGEGQTLNNIAVVYLDQGRYGEALPSFKQALAILQAVGDRAGEGATLANIGEMNRVLSHYDEALANCLQALAILQAVGNRAGEGQTLAIIGLLYYSQGRYDEALASYERVLAIAREVGNRAGEGASLNNIGEVYRAQGRYDEALASYERALAITQEVGNRVGEGAILTNIGAVYDAEGRYGEALHYYSGGTEVLENVRSAAGSDQARTDFIENYAFAYDRAIALLDQQDDVAQAFWYSERGRARVLLDAISTRKVQLSDNAAATLLAAEQEAYAARQSAQDALTKARATNPPNPAWVDEAEAALGAAEAVYTQTVAAITDYSVQLATLIPGRQQVPQLAEVQALLPADTTLLSYWTLEDKTLAFVITDHSADIIELPGVTAQTVLTMTTNLLQWRNRDIAYPLPLRQLYAALIAPLADKLQTPRLIIIPHQSLHYVPFAALIDDAHDKQYLGEKYTLTLLPSASVLPFLQQNAVAAQANPTDGAVVFGDPASSEPGLPRLHNTAAEAGAVAALLATTPLTDTAATEALLYQMAADARIVHLAAHGQYNSANTLYSALYLAPSSPLTATDPLSPTAGLPTVDSTLDGRLETWEIFGLPLKGNDLVVLSACETTVNDLAKESRVALSRGDELVSLTRAFIFAGAPTVIASLWSVDDAATETLMVSFYKHWLQDGMSKAQALQAAQADVRREPRWASPFYWAGFVLHGDPGAPGAK